MIRLFFLDSDHIFYNELKSWLPDYCTIHQVKFDDIEKFLPLLNPSRDIFFIDPAYTGDNPDYLEPLIKKLLPVPIIFISESISLTRVVSSIKMGAYTYLHKKDDKSLIIESVKKILYENPVNRQNSQDPFPEIVGSSGSLQKIKQNILSLGKRNISIHLQGETGSGKGLTAKVIHSNSPYCKRKMISVNCGAISENLLESELFGSKKGAFTDAIDRPGLFERAHESTIFLDEVAELSHAAQVKLLRVLDNGSFSRVGDTDEKSSCFRLITATNKDLKKEMTEGRFRKDLYYRITTVIMEIPPLRERVLDIPVLTEYFLRKIECRKRITEKAMIKLTGHSWPGNIRELHKVIERAEYLSDNSGVIDEMHIEFY